MSDFTSFNFNEKILKVLNEIGYVKPTAIQETAIPQIMMGSDIIASAQTGTGKTGAFMLPILHMLASTPPQKGSKIGPQILILVPTRELAMQVAEESKKFSKYLPFIKTVCIFGGVPYPIQRRMLSAPYDILVATPGRLIDHMDQGRIDLSRIKMLVLDEADRMLDMGFIEPVECIAAASPADRQTLMFSATIDNKILPISRKLQKNPQEIRMQIDKTLEANIDHVLFYVDNIGHKMRMLEHMLKDSTINQAIIFTSTIRQTDELADRLCEWGYHAEALHGDMNQRQRTRTIDKLRRGGTQVLVATDVAARGIDISTVSHVFNFDLPFRPEDFVHRIGRTGRAGAKGAAITFGTFREEALIKRIAAVMGKPMISQTIAGLEPKAREKFAPAAGRQRNRPSRFQSGGGRRPGGSGGGNSRDGGGGGQGQSFGRSGDGGGGQRQSFGRSSSGGEGGGSSQRQSFGRSSGGEAGGGSQRQSFGRSGGGGGGQGQSFGRPKNRPGNAPRPSFYQN